jgi:enoyl-CoA hydratase
MNAVAHQNFISHSVVCGLAIRGSVIGSGFDPYDLTLCQIVDPTDTSPTAGDPVVLAERRGPVAVITLNRPDARNALNAELVAAFPRAIRDADTDPEVRAIVLTGADPAFCAGFDRRDVDGGKKKGENPHPGYWGALPATRVPVIGAINGAAVTGGFEIALACDFLIASDRARFADTHTKVGMVPGWGLTVVLPRIIGPARARYMSFTGEFVDAHTARDWGLVVEVVEHTRLVDRAVEIGAAIAGTHAEATTEVRALYDDVRALGDTDEAFAFENRRAREWAARRFGGA